MKRKLNVGEIEILQSIYYNDIDYDIVVITNEHLFSQLLKRFSAIVFDNTIVFTKKSYTEDFSKSIHEMALLVHEICHVWQYQNLNYRWFKAGYEHIKYRHSTYTYFITDQKRLTDFRFEQQGEIMADYYRLIQKKSNTLPIYEKIIYQDIKKENRN
jgi:hypothetical protein